MLSPKTLKLGLVSDLKASLFKRTTGQAPAPYSLFMRMAVPICGPQNLSLKLLDLFTPIPQSDRQIRAPLHSGNLLRVRRSDDTHHRRTIVR
jgi:hypothetical protein